MAAVLLRVTLGGRGPRVVSIDEVVQPTFLALSQLRAELALEGPERTVRGDRGAFCSVRTCLALCRLRRRGSLKPGLSTAGEMGSKRFKRAEVLEQLAQADLDTEFTREHQGRLRKNERIESQFQDARIDWRCRQVGAGQIAEKLAKFGKHGVIVTRGLFDRF